MIKDYAKPIQLKETPQTKSLLQVSPYVPLFLAFLGIVVIVGLVYKPHSNPTEEKTIEPSQASAPTVPPAANIASPPLAKKPRFDFYTMLPNMDITPSDDSELSAPTPIIPQKPVPSSDKSRYWIQAASFQEQNQAEQLRATLALEGFESDIKIASFALQGSAQQETWYRVVLGPFPTEEKTKAIQNRIEMRFALNSLVSKSID